MIQDRRPPRNRERARDSVAEQPGAMVFWAGVGVALVLGLLIRGLINPQLVQQRVEVAAKQIHSSVQVSFESAEISLAQGWWPQFAVLIHRVRMSSANRCWLSPQLIADQIRLPLSLTALFRGESPLREIQAGDVEVRFTSERPSACDRGDVVLGPQNLSAEPRAIRIVRPDAGLIHESTERAGRIERLVIRRLLLASDIPSAPGSLNLGNFHFYARSVQPVLFSLHSDLFLNRSGTLDDSSFKALVSAEYKEFPEKSVTLRLDGRAREGTYKMNALYSPDRGDARVVADFKQIPLAELFEVLKSRGTPLGDFKPRLSWVSFRAETEGPVKEFWSRPLGISRFRLEGNMGGVVADHVQLLSLSPLKVGPSSFVVESLDLDQVFSFMGRGQATPVLNKIGRFKGEVALKDEMNFEMKGEHSGLEFIFSNQSRREIQRVDRLEGSIRREAGTWRAQITQADVVQGEFLGAVDLRIDPGFQELEVGLKAQRLSLAPRVQQLMTAGGEIAPVEADLRLRLRQGQVLALRGSAKLPRATVSGVRLQGLGMNFSGQTPALQVSTKIDRLGLPQGILRISGLSSVFPSSWFEADQLLLSKVAARFQVRQLNDLRWSSVSAKASRGGGEFSSSGGWGFQGDLFGRLTLREGPRNRSFSIGGTRDNPVLDEAKKEARP